jgi:hypothetical protein
MFLMNTVSPPSVDAIRAFRETCDFVGNHHRFGSANPV